MLRLTGLQPDSHSRTFTPHASFIACQLQSAFASFCKPHDTRAKIKTAGGRWEILLKWRWETSSSRPCSVPVLLDVLLVHSRSHHLRRSPRSQRVRSILLRSLFVHARYFSLWIGVLSARRCRLAPLSSSLVLPVAPLARRTSSRRSAGVRTVVRVPSVPCRSSPAC